MRSRWRQDRWWWWEWREVLWRIGIHSLYTHTHTKSNHVSLFSSFLAADAAAAAVTVRPNVIRWRWMNHQQQRQQQREKGCNWCRNANRESSSGIRASMYRSAVAFLVIDAKWRIYFYLLLICWFCQLIVHHQFTFYCWIDARDRLRDAGQPWPTFLSVRRSLPTSANNQPVTAFG